MEAFERWETEDCFNRECPDLDCDECVGLRRAGFRAALEWVRDNDDGHCCGDYSEQHGEWEECPRTTAINKELETK